MFDIYDAELGNSDLWEVETFTFEQVQRTTVGRNPAYYPIPDFVIPVYRRSRIMAVNFNNSLAKPHWKLGCYLKQSIAAPSAVEPDSFSDVYSWRVPLNSLLVFFPLPAVTVWQVRASVPYWHEEARLTIYRFTGAIDQPLASRLTQLELKLDDISSRI